jgi:ABC-type nickel/cobalt efflux system permease component RcnA
MGAGRSIAVQNFNEQACILGLGALYSFSTAAGLPAVVAITAFGLIVAGFKWVIMKWHQHNLRHHGAELDRLLEIARRDDLHG